MVDGGRRQDHHAPLHPQVVVSIGNGETVLLRPVQVVLASRVVVESKQKLPSPATALEQHDAGVDELLALERREIGPDILRPYFCLRPGRQSQYVL